MTKKIEEFFDLEPAETSEAPVEESKELAQVDESSKSLSMHERIDSALPEVKNLGEHDDEMSDVAQKAMEAYENLMTLGMNMSDAHAGKIFEVAASMLKTAMDANDAKATKKMKMIEMQLKKAKVDLDAGQYTGGDSSGVEFDRNDLIKMIKDQKSNDSDK